MSLHLLFPSFTDSQCIAYWLLCLPPSLDDHDGMRVTWRTSAGVLPDKARLLIAGRQPDWLCISLGLSLKPIQTPDMAAGLEETMPGWRPPTSWSSPHNSNCQPGWCMQRALRQPPTPCHPSKQKLSQGLQGSWTRILQACPFSPSVAFRSRSARSSCRWT